MTMSHLIGHLRSLWRTERTVAELRTKRLLTNLGLQALAALIAACALLLFELAVYFALVQRWDAIWSAVTLGFVDVALACLIGLVAVRRHVARELALAHDVHQQAIADFEAELQDADGPASIRTAIENALLPALVPLIPLLVERLQAQGRDERRRSRLIS
ncbi:phage holin family protein [Bradyrhizobium sp.]|uniref:phage holin family protein n=1 Tax=Bradyrhizobium sp. TaxID=376 RepID=UPI003C6A03DD